MRSRPLNIVIARPEGPKQSYQSFIFPALLLILPWIFNFSAYADGAKYDPAGRRDPFIPLVGSERPINAGLENVASVEDIKLEGIAIGSRGKSRAIMNGEMVKERDKIGILEIKKITKNEVIILLGETEHRLTLSEEAGVQGGK